MKRLISPGFLSHIPSVDVTHKQNRETGGIEYRHADAIGNIEQSLEDVTEHDEGECEYCHDKYLALMVNNYFCVLAFI